MASIIPEVLNHFNIYNGANALVGVSGEVELPELEAITDTVEGTGVLGEIEDPVTGQFSSATIKIPFAVLYSDMFSIVNTTEPPLLTLRGSMQCTDPKTGATGYYPIRVVVRGKAKTTTLGKVAKGKFQSTLPRGERPYTEKTWRRQSVFQSTLPRGERQYLKQLLAIMN